MRKTRLPYCLLSLTQILFQVFRFPPLTDEEQAEQGLWQHEGRKHIHEASYDC